jgi:PAS domain S-box-containing protein
MYEFTVLGPSANPLEVNMLDSSLINHCEEAIPANFDLVIPNKQSAFRRTMRNPLHRPCEESRDKLLNNGLENGNLCERIDRAPRLDEQKWVADEIERRVAERTKELAEANEELQLQAGLLQHLPVSAWTLKPDGTPDFVNQVWLDYSGQTLDFVRSHPEAWMNAVHPDDRERASNSFWEGIRSGNGFSIETRSLRARDGVYRWHLNQAVVLRDADGRVLKFVGTTTDIDDQKRAEETLNELRSELAHMARVTSLGALSASIAHEVNQPLGGIVTNAGTCLRKLSADRPDIDGAREAARRVIRDSNRASEVIDRLRALFSKKEATVESVDLNDAAREVVALCSEELQRNRVILRQEFAADIPRITGDRVQLQQVILNLLRNASDAMSGVDDRPRALVIRTDRGEGDCVRLTVQDTGVGITHQEMERLFDAFYTTKSDGMGMGLSVSRSIIENHSGRLWASPNDGPGATFSFSIPCATKISKSKDSYPLCLFDPVLATQ